MRIYFDASVIIAALLSPTGGSRKLFKYIKSHKLVGVTSQTAIEEVLEKSKKINKSKEKIKQFIARSGLLVRKYITTEEIVTYQNLVDKEDAHLIAGANLTKCSHLVTLNKKHLLKRHIKKRFLPFRILSPKEILEEIDQSKKP